MSPLPMTSCVHSKRRQLESPLRF